MFGRFIIQLIQNIIDKRHLDGLKYLKLSVMINGICDKSANGVYEDKDELLREQLCTFRQSIE